MTIGDDVICILMDSMANLTAEDVLCMQFCPSGSFKFPKHPFGAKGLQRSFQSEWCKNYNWLHYNVSKDAAFCYLYMHAECEKKFLATGFTYWKEATTAFDKHQASTAHCEDVKSLVLLPSQIQGDVSEMCNHSHKEEKKANRKMFMHILKIIRFLVHQGLPLRDIMMTLKANLLSCYVCIMQAVMWIDG